MMKKKRLNKNAKDDLLAVSDQTDERVGSVCVSMAGHDRGLLLVVVAGVDPEHVLTADGKTRKLIAPKKKKMRHLRLIMIQSIRHSDVIWQRHGLIVR